MLLSAKTCGGIKTSLDIHFCLERIFKTFLWLEIYLSMHYSFKFNSSHRWSNPFSSNIYRSLSFFPYTKLRVRKMYRMTAFWKLEVIMNSKEQPIRILKLTKRTFWNSPVNFVYSHWSSAAFRCQNQLFAVEFSSP